MHLKSMCGVGLQRLQPVKFHIVYKLLLLLLLKKYIYVYTQWEVCYIRESVTMAEEDEE